MYMSTMTYPKIGNLVNGGKHLYTLKDDDTELVKIMRKETLESDPKMIEISQGHKNICAIKRCDYDGVTYDVYIEKLNGNDLFDYMMKNKLDSDKIKNIMIQILEGLQYLHKNGVVHGDVKLENVIVCDNIYDSTSNIKIIDFGLSWRIGASFMRYGGSYPYVSPETYLKSNTILINEKADIWSLGILLYSLVEGKYPFVAYSDDSEYPIVVTQKLIYIRDHEGKEDYNFEKTVGIDNRIWDPVLLNMVKKMVLYDPSKRSSAQELLDMLCQISVDI